MPAVTRTFVHLALLWLLVGATVGGVMLGGGVLGWALPVGSMLSVHVEAMLFGWMLQVTVAVAWWILPRVPSPRGSRWAGEDGRGNAVLAWVCFGALNAGVVLSVAARAVGAGALLVGGRVLALAALGALVVQLAPRARAFGDG